MTPHKWAKEIKAWADGAEIQYRIKPRVEGGEYSAWVTQKNPQWYTGDVSEYRIKPGQDVKDPSVEAFERGEPVSIKDVLIERLIGDPKREALLAEAVDLLKWMNDNSRLLCDGSIRWRAQEVIKTYEG